MSPFARHLLATAIPLATAAVVVATGSYVLARHRSNGDRSRARRAAVRALLATYVLGLAWWTIVLANPNYDGSRHANLAPFREIARSLTDREPGYGLLNFWGNIVAFVPLGALALVSLRRSRGAWLAAFGAGVAVSVAIEITQYSIGRSADVDDVILNAAGVALGVAFARIMWSSAHFGPKSPHEERSANSLVP